MLGEVDLFLIFWHPRGKYLGSLSAFLFISNFILLANTAQKLVEEQYLQFPAEIVVGSKLFLEG